MWARAAASPGAAAPGLAFASGGARPVWAHRGRTAAAPGAAAAAASGSRAERPAPARHGGAATLAGAAALLAAGRRRRSLRLRAAEGEARKEPKVTPVEVTPVEAELGPSAEEAKPKVTAEEARTMLAEAGGYENLSQDQRNAVSSFFFPDEQELDMDKSMPLEDHIKELRDGAVRAAVVAVVCVSLCLYYYKELTQLLEGPASGADSMVKFVQLAPGEFFFVSVKVAISVGLLLAFPYALFEAAVYFAPALTKTEREVVGPVVLGSSVLFYAGAIFSQSALAPAALGFFIDYGKEVIESQFSIDQYFEFILSMGFATGIAFQVPVVQVVLGMFGVLKSEQLFSVWKYVIVASAIVGAILTPSTDPVTQLLLSGALCALYFAGAGVLVAIGK